MDPRDRQEPKLTDLGNEELRPPRHYQPQRRGMLSDLWLEIALGVFFGMLAHTIVVAAYVRWELNQSTRQFFDQAKKYQERDQQRTSHQQRLRQEKIREEKIYRAQEQDRK